MNLEEIEAKADELAALMLEVVQVGDIPARLEGLAHLAQIKAVRDRRHVWNAHVGMRERDNEMRQREISAMEVAADAASRAIPPAGGCTSRINSLIPGHPPLLCELSHGHPGRHLSGNTSWDLEAEPTKPAVDRLHELVSYLEASKEGADQADDGGDRYESGRLDGMSKAYRDAATKLQEILSEGGI